MSSLIHMRQLDGLRGIAIFGVFVAHFLQLSIKNPLFLPYGSMGVRLFFVLSGFLITGILVKARGRIDRGEQTVAYTLKAFYARRCLRLFVVFYLWIISLRVVFGYSDRFWWDFFYASNFYDILMSEGRGNHYWSLAVEEQFYFLWPWLILFLRRKCWPALFVATIGVAIITRLLMAMNGAEYLVVKKFPITCMDCLAAGGLVAWMFYRENPWSRAVQIRSAAVCTIVGGFVFAISIYCLKSAGAKNALYTMTLHTGCAFLFTGILIPAIEGYRGVVGKILSAGPICWLGRVSYGCYLYHLLVRDGVDSISRRLSIESPLILDFLMKTSLTLLMAWASWTILESRVNELKKHFPMKLQESKS